MCLFAMAHRASPQFPLVIAANRDEEYARPTVPAAFWTGHPDVVGGRDVLHGGSWLAIDRTGRFAAVTNLKAARGVIGNRSRGSLVGAFVTGRDRPLDYARQVESLRAEYAGFHLVVGIAGQEAVQLSGTLTVVPPGIAALSNADPGVRWPKVDAAEEELRRLIGVADRTELCRRLMLFLAGGEPGTRGGPASGEVDTTREIFVAGDRYGTRSSTVIIVDAEGEVLFVEQSFGRNGAVMDAPRELRFEISRPAA